MVAVGGEVVMLGVVELGPGLMSVDAVRLL